MQKNPFIVAFLLVRRSETVHITKREKAKLEYIIPIVKFLLLARNNIFYYDGRNCIIPERRGKNVAPEVCVERDISPKAVSAS
jgi:hypothetical protein